MEWRDFLSQIPVENVENVEKESEPESHIPHIPLIPRQMVPQENQPRQAQLAGYECGSCMNLEHRCERIPGTRRLFFWRCGKGHDILEAGYHGERVWIAPPDCDDYEIKKHAREMH
jgi:hypothetical protein